MRFFYDSLCANKKAGKNMQKSKQNKCDNTFANMQKLSTKKQAKKLKNSTKIV